MTKWVELDPAFSTTRRVFKVSPQAMEAELKARHKSEDQFATMLFLLENGGRKVEGGLRTRGCFKKSSNEMPLFTIITVVFNGEAHLEKTILSVINQTYDNIEYIIIDGGSTDGTLDIIREYSNVIDYWVSEADKGVYDAMNKSLQIVTGSWINFMNSGDIFYSEEIVDKVSDVIKKNAKVNIIFGLAVEVNGHKILPRNLTKYFLFDRMVCHQAIFSSIDIYKSGNLFSLDYEIISDKVWLFNAISSGEKSINVNFPICYFALGGICGDYIKKYNEDKLFRALYFNRFELIHLYLFSFFRRLFNRINTLNFRIPVMLLNYFRN